MTIHIAGSDGNRFELLEQGVAKWGWLKEAEELLWKLAGDRDKQKAALTTLYQFYLEKGDTSSLYRAVARLAAVNPDDDGAQNNLAQLSLLLNLNWTARTNPPTACIARILTTRCLLRPMRFRSFERAARQAVDVMNKLKPEELEQSAFAGYYGIISGGGRRQIKGRSVSGARGGRANASGRAGLIGERGKQDQSVVVGSVQKNKRAVVCPLIKKTKPVRPWQAFGGESHGRRQSRWPLRQPGSLMLPEQRRFHFPPIRADTDHC